MLERAVDGVEDRQRQRLSRGWPDGHAAEERRRGLPRGEAGRRLRAGAGPAGTARHGRAIMTAVTNTSTAAHVSRAALHRALADLIRVPFLVVKLPMGMSRLSAADVRTMRPCMRRSLHRVRRAGIACLRADVAVRGETYAITRAKGPITIDGNLSDEGWRDALRIERWYEINPGDNIGAAGQERRISDLRRQVLLRGVRVRRSESESDHRAVRRSRLHPGQRRFRRHVSRHAKRGPHGLRVSGHRAQRPVRRRAWTTTAAARTRRRISSGSRRARINDHGWTLEIRIPFSSLRYRNVDPQTWGIMLCRNYARDFRLPDRVGEACRAAASASSAGRAR